MEQTSSLEQANESLREIAVTPNHIVEYLGSFLCERDYDVGDFVVTQKSRFSNKIGGYYTIDSFAGEEKKVKVTITPRLLGGYGATLEDEDEPYLCPDKTKYEFEFSKKGRAMENADGAVLVDLPSFFLRTEKQKDPIFR